MVVACFFTLYLAIRHQDSLVRDDYYKEGLAINRDLARAQYAREHAIAGVLSFDAATLAVELQLDNALPTTPGLRLEILHPTDQARDQVLTLLRAGDNIFAGKAAASLDGVKGAMLPWILRRLNERGYSTTATDANSADFVELPENPTDLVDNFLRVRYPVPLAETPSTVREIMARVVRYLLHDQRASRLRNGARLCIDQLVQSHQSGRNDHCCDGYDNGEFGEGFDEFHQRAFAEDPAETRDRRQFGEFRRQA